MTSNAPPGAEEDLQCPFIDKPEEIEYDEWLHDDDYLFED